MSSMDKGALRCRLTSLASVLMKSMTEYDPEQGLPNPEGQLQLVETS
jgi:hypothetical protein